MNLTGYLRIARATTQLERVVAFYRGLGFPLVERFEGHDGYAGVILAAPGGTQLEFTQHARGRRASLPDADDLLVIYLPSAEVARLRRRLKSRGHACVAPVNPYWLDKSVTFEDPDRWRVVLCAASAAAFTPQPARCAPAGVAPRSPGRRATCR